MDTHKSTKKLLERIISNATKGIYVDKRLKRECEENYKLSFECDKSYPLVEDSQKLVIRYQGVDEDFEALFHLRNNIDAYRSRN